MEDLGRDLGAYQDPYQFLGKWEWDLVRSARLAIDVGIHAKGWKKSEALSFWKDHVPNQDGIAVREIDRIIRWPAQVISYKVGENTIWRLRNLTQDAEGAKFDLRRFHTLVLKRGSVPLPILEEKVKDSL